MRYFEIELLLILGLHYYSKGFSVRDLLLRARYQKRFYFFQTNPFSLPVSFPNEASLQSNDSMIDPMTNTGTRRCVKLDASTYWIGLRLTQSMDSLRKFFSKMTR